MPPRLVALDDGADIILDRAMVVIGRHPQCDARLDSLRVSRHHCCMSIDQGTVLVRDLGSTNGIRINGHRVEFGRLHDGDELTIAHIRYRLSTGVVHEATLADSPSSRNGHDRRSSRSSLNGKFPLHVLDQVEGSVNGSANEPKGTAPAPDSKESRQRGMKQAVAPPAWSPPSPIGRDDAEDSFEPPSSKPLPPLARPVEQVPPENALAAAVRGLLPADMADRCRIQVIVQLPEPEQAPGQEKLEACLPDSPL